MHRSVVHKHAGVVWVPVRRPRRHVAVLALAAATGVQLALVTPALAAPTSPASKVWVPPKTPTPKTTPVPRGHQQGETGSEPDPTSSPPAYQPPAVKLPAAGASTVSLTPARAAGLPDDARTPGRNPGRPGLVRVADSPVWVAPADSDGDAPAQVQVSFPGVETADRAHVDSGLMLAVARADGQLSAGHLQVQVDTNAVAGRYGGNYAQRLQLVQLPACALSTPDVPACQARTPVDTVRDLETGRLRADVTLSATTAPPAPSSAAAPQATASGQVVLAAAATPAGSAGTYAATSLKPSDQWSAGGSTGNFTYRYPVTLPPALAGGPPGVELSYSSADVDGMTAADSAQASWLGVGWSYDPGYIERSYQDCSKQGLTNSSDTCWAWGGYEVSLGGSGSAGSLVYDDTTHAWRLSSDAGARIQLLSGANNGAYSGEYWVITQQDGTRYYYGAGHLPAAEGGSGVDPASNATWTQPVYCPHSGDPCYTAGSGTNSFAANMAWRWNLDYVVDPHGNTTVYSYGTESNYYARGSSHTLTPYTRGGYLKQISYGWRASDVASQATPTPAVEVVFATGQRCSGSATECASYANLTAATAKDWPDTPYDMICPATGTCANTSMSYFSTVRLQQIQTLVRNAGSYKPVDTYTLAHSFPSPGDSTSPSLWLDGITHIGNDASTVATLPAVSFGGTMLPNRVPGSGTWPDYNHMRLSVITTETGERINVGYSRTTPSVAACSQSPGAQVLPSPNNNTMLCYQQYWAAPGQSDPNSDWFNKYVVNNVQQVDQVASSPTMVTSYSYGGTPAWHRDDSPQTQNSRRSWNQFRGFGQVTTQQGVAPDPITQTTTTYLRGMNGDYTTQTGGTQKSVTVTDSLGDQVVDNNIYAGSELETDTYSQAGGSVQSKTVKLPWSAQTASHAETSQPGLPARTANFINTGTEKTSELLSGGTWRTTKTINVYSTSTGLLQRSDAQGDQSLVGAANSQEVCTTSSYATPPSSGRNTGMVNLPSRRTAVSVSTGGPIGTQTCPTPTADNTVADTLTYYDGNTTDPGVISTVGDVTQTSDIDDYTGTTPVYTRTQAGAFDAYGRVTSSTDARGLTTTTAYTPAAGQLVTGTVSTNTATGWITTSTLNPARQQPTKVVDPNGNVAAMAYDGLGRLTGVWLPGRATTQTASITHVYRVNGTSAPSWVQTKTLRDDGTYQFAYTIYDGTGRVRQTQNVSVDGTNGSQVSDTFYDSHGWTVKATNPYYVTAFPASTIYPAADASVPGETLTSYDGQGRVTASRFYSHAQPQWQTTTSYPGAERTDVTPPTGGTATSTFTDAMDRTSSLWHYTTATPDGDPSHAQAINYTYTPDGQPATVTGPATGQVWTYRYDLHGHPTATTDPDAGDSSATYNPAGDKLTVTDGRGQVLAYKYDPMGRKTDEYLGSTSGTRLAAWTYDTAPGGKGKPATATVYVNGASYTTETTGYSNRGTPTGTSITIPQNEGKLAGTYSTSTTYEPISGLPTSTSYGPDGGLPSETVSYAYDQNGNLSYVGGIADYLVADVVDPFGRPTSAHMGNMPNQVVQTNVYDDATGRLTEQYLDKQSGSSHVDDSVTYWNPAGLITASKDVQDGSTTDLQCYGYDQLGELTSAWTDTAGTRVAASPSVPNIGGCQTTRPTAATLGGPAAYWQTYAYNAAGNRTTMTEHAVDGNTAHNTTHDYAYPGSSGQTEQPDTLQSVTTSGPGGTSTDTYGYDPAGNTTTRTIGAGPHQSITYDPDGRTRTITDATSGATSSYLYDADGNLLIQRSTTGASGSATLYLGGDEQLSLNTANDALSGLRYYPVPGGPTEIRSSTGTLTYEYANAQNTGQVLINAGPNQTQTRRYYTPYGQPRGTAPTTWVDNRAFLNQPADPATALDLLGARNYDPATGRFLQVDPVFTSTDPQQLGGYSYAGNNPVNESDPTGLCPADRCIGYGQNPGQSGPHANPIMPGHQAGDDYLPQGLTAQQVDEIERARDARAAQQRAAQQKEQQAKRKHHWWDRPVNFIVRAAPIITALAIATSFIPGINFASTALALAVQALTLLADVADVALTIAYGFKVYEDFHDPGHTTGEKVSDTANLALGATGVSLGGVKGLFKGLGTYIPAAAIKNAKAGWKLASQERSAALAAMGTGGRAWREATRADRLALRQGVNKAEAAYNRALRLPDQFGAATGAARGLGFLSSTISQPELAYMAVGSVN